MTRFGIALGIGLAGAVAFVALPGGAPRDAVAANPAKAAAKCRRTIGQVVLKAVTAGLKSVQKCHVQRLKGRSTGDCSALGSAFETAKAQAIARMNIACKAANAQVAPNYGSETVAGGFPLVFDAMRSALETNGAALQAAVVFDGDAKSVKGKKKCHAALGIGRTAVVQGVLKGAIKCQGRLDKHAQVFGTIDPSCIVGAGAGGSKANGKISKACSAFSGLDVGSCDGLPGCLVTSAEETGQRVARLTFGGAAVCGNGVQDLGEVCDDGNTVGGDGCEADCQLPTCGDLVVNQASEQCDDPSGLGGDLPTENCFQCKLNVCGDGNLDGEEPGIEECDVGAEDACPGRCQPDCTCGPVICGANGLKVTLALAYDEATLGGVSATELGLLYPAAVSIPGSLFQQSVRDRITSLLSTDYTIRGSDRDSNADTVDDRVQVDASSALRSIDPAPVAQVQFDCPQGTPVQPADLPCTIAQLIDQAGTPFPDALKLLARCVVTLEVP